MELTILDRLMLWAALDGFEGTFGQVRAAAKLRTELFLMQEERDAVGWVQDEHGYHWDAEKDTGVEFDLSEHAHAACVKALKKLDEDGKLTAQHIPLCEKFGIE